ncbi:glycoside hydrolase family 16 protein [Algibacter mikhailovii]|nr:glycoside hydrolase family 16 protein [Algibacter mikhailovii]
MRELKLRVMRRYTFLFPFFIGTLFFVLNFSVLGEYDAFVVYDRINLKQVGRDVSSSRLENLDKSHKFTFNTLVWSDEFEGQGGIDTSKWFHQTKLILGDRWANNEEQHYTARIENAYVANGTLRIKAKKEPYTDQGHQKEYTSARLNSKFAFKYGKVVVRAKLPNVAGTWPAIWLLGKNIKEIGGYWTNEGFGKVTWPHCGEIDIMEPNIEKTQTLATWHWFNGREYQMNSKQIPLSNVDASQNFHDFILEWDSKSMRIYLDDTLVNEMSTVKPYDKEFYILLNLAMGGNLGGIVDPDFTEDIMEIDFVRVYQ